ncbi:MAG TPA: hypothetical protein VK497_05200 [Candidatus Saccharimonadales bacterium]|nr:hypothetical protein [Candidatus Saccharimonadales bacterium]
MDNFDPQYMDEITRIIHGESEGSYNQLKDMFSRDVAQQVTKVITRWCPDDRPNGMWVFVGNANMALVFTPDMMLGYSDTGPAYCEMFLKSLDIPAELVDGVSATATRHRQDRQVVATFSRAGAGWDTDTEFGAKK